MQVQPPRRAGSGRTRQRPEHLARPGVVLVVTDAIINWWFGLIEWVVQGVPSSDPVTSELNFSFISDLNYFLPISEMFTLFIGVFALGGPLAIVSAVIWLTVGVLRGGSTKA